MGRNPGARVDGTPADSSAPSPALLWIASVVLVLPAAWPYVLHYLHAGGDMATGFIQVDMATYMGHAREYFDGGGLTYGNPSSPSYDTPRVYFQPWTLLLGIVWRLTGLDPGTVFVAFGLVAAVACTRVAIGLYQRVVGLRGVPGWLGLVAFVWGGGLLFVASVAYNAATGDFSASVLRFDPDEGWWFLNLGRNFVYPSEAFVHTLFLGTILAIYLKRFALALVLAAVASASHPFTGVQLLLVLTTWAIGEKFLVRGGHLRSSFVAVCSGLLALHLGYHMGFLSRFPEHRSLMEHWAQPWAYGLENIAPAYALVGALAAWRMRRLELARRVLDSPENRLLLVWFAVSLALANHELVMEPTQPLHFTRGYVWMPLFLLGAPVLVSVLARLWSSRRRTRGVIATGAVVALFTLDNAVWFAKLDPPFGLYMTGDEVQLMDWLDRGDNRGHVVLASSEFVGYLATVHTPLRAWHSHHYNTPFSHDRIQESQEFFREGTFHPGWRELDLLVIYSVDDQVRPGSPLGDGIPPDLEATIRFRNGTFTAVEVEADPGVPR